MENEKTFLNLLEGLAQALQMPEIGVSENGRESMLVIGDFEVILQCMDTGSLMIFTVVAPLPEYGREHLMTQMLEANTFLVATEGFTLAASESTGVTLQGIASFRILGRDNIGAFVQSFISVAEHWQQVCRDLEDSVSTAQAYLTQDTVLNSMKLRV